MNTRRVGTTVLSALLSAGVLAQVPTGNFGTQQASDCGTDRVAVTSFNVNNTSPSRGQSVTATLALQNKCTGKSLSIPWSISKDGAVIGSGTASNVPANGTTNVSASWTARAGTYVLSADADPSNSTNEQSSARGNNVATDLTINVAGDWSAWAEKAKDAAQAEIREWIHGTGIAGNVSGSTLTITPHSLQSTYSNMARNISSRLTGQGVPQDVASAFGNAISDRWADWASFYGGNIDSAYPSFDRYSAPLAPPTANAERSICSAQFVDISRLDANAVGNALRQKAGSAMEDKGAAAAIDGFANWFGSRSANWCSNGKLRNVMGGGPAVGFAPPVSPNGRVTGPAAGTNVFTDF